MMRNLALYLAVAVAAAGCAGGGAPNGDAAAPATPSQTDSAAAQAAADSIAMANWAPADFAITTGQTGMGAGQMRGFQIMPGGEVYRWTGRAIGQNRTDLGFISENQGDSLWKWTREADFFEVASQRTGNQTQFLSITADSTTRRASWAVGPGIERPSGPVQKLYDDIVAMIGGLED